MKYIDKFKELFDCIEYNDCLVDSDLWNIDEKRAVIEVLRRCNIFDEKTYLINNQDVLESNIDPIEHYIRNGIDEGRKIFKNRNFVQKDKISIIIPVYNSEKYLDDCIKSLVAQTYNNIEIICINDGSTDKSQNILNKYKAVDKRIKIINQKNQGAAVARNKGIEYANGKYLLIVDSDDYFDENMILKLVEKAQKSKADVVVCRSKKVNLNNEIEEIEWTINKRFLPKKEIFNIKDFSEYAFQLFVGWSWDKLIKRDLIDKFNIRFQNLRSTNDAFFSFICIILASSISIIDDKLIYHRERSGSLSKTRHKDPTCFIKAIEEIYNYLILNSLYSIVKKSFINWISHFCVWHLTNIDDSSRLKIINCLKNSKIKNILSITNAFYYDKYSINLLKQLIDNKPCVSIIVPNYNNEKYLRECIESIQKQTLFNIEIIAINDGSTDNSINIINECALNDKRIIVVDKKNTGYGNSMNIGLKHAKGQYVGIVESDDFVPENMYEVLYRKAVENDCDLVKADFYRFKTNDNGGYDLEYNKLDKENKYYNKVIDITSDLAPFKFIMNTWSGIYKNDFLKKNNILHNETPGASFQDNGFYFQTFINCKRAYFINKPFYMNRRDNENSSVFAKNKVYAFSKEYDFIYKIIKSDIKYSKFVSLCWLKRFHNYMFNLRRVSEDSRDEFLEFMYKEFKKANESHELDVSSFSLPDTRNLLLLLDNKKMFLEKILKQK